MTPPRVPRIPAHLRHQPSFRDTAFTVQPTAPGDLDDMPLVPANVVHLHRAVVMPAGHSAMVASPTAPRGDGCPTVRRFARTQAEAFADVRAPAIERPAPRRWQDDAIEACLWVLMAVVFTAPFWWHLVARALR